ncbi:MAG: hypothetical protein PHV62_01135 [Sulfuricurvum sp.]|nr:hypothetical protein [Sulfuricurvum sp.]
MHEEVTRIFECIIAFAIVLMGIVLWKIKKHKFLPHPKDASDVEEGFSFKRC